MHGDFRLQISCILNHLHTYLPGFLAIMLIRRPAPRLRLPSHFISSPTAAPLQLDLALQTLQSLHHVSRYSRLIILQARLECVGLLSRSQRAGVILTLRQSMKYVHRSHMAETAGESDPYLFNWIALISFARKWFRLKFLAGAEVRVGWRCVLRREIRP